jgi:hypothetical protein
MHGSQCQLPAHESTNCSPGAGPGAGISRAAGARDTPPPGRASGGAPSHPRRPPRPADQNCVLSLWCVVRREMQQSGIGDAHESIVPVSPIPGVLHLSGGDPVISCVGPRFLSADPSTWHAERGIGHGASAARGVRSVGPGGKAAHAGWCRRPVWPACCGPRRVTRFPVS